MHCVCVHKIRSEVSPSLTQIFQMLFGQYILFDPLFEARFPNPGSKSNQITFGPPRLFSQICVVLKRSTFARWLMNNRKSVSCPLFRSYATDILRPHQLSLFFPPGNATIVIAQKQTTTSAWTVNENPSVICCYLASTATKCDKIACKLLLFHQTWSNIKLCQSIP